MGFLLDRDVLSAAENPKGNANVRAWRESVPDDELFISAITIMEARKGFARLRTRPGVVLREEAGVYEENFDQLLIGFQGRIVSVDHRVADCWGEMLGQREANILDTALAATATVHDLVVATRNLRHFRGRGIKVIDPFRNTPEIAGPV